MNTDLFNKAAQWVGLILYSAAMGIATGELPIDPKYAWISVIAGGVMRNLSNANSTTLKTLSPNPPP